MFSLRGYLLPYSHCSSMSYLKLVELHGMEFYSGSFKITYLKGSVCLLLENSKKKKDPHATECRKCSREAIIAMKIPSVPFWAHMVIVLFSLHIFVFRSSLSRLTVQTSAFIAYGQAYFPLFFIVW